MRHTANKSAQKFQDALEKGLGLVLDPSSGYSWDSRELNTTRILCGGEGWDNAEIVVRFHGREDKVKVWVEWRGKKQDPGLVPKISLWKDWVWFGGDYGYTDHRGAVFMDLLRDLMWANDFLAPEGAGERVFGEEAEERSLRA